MTQRTTPTQGSFSFRACSRILALSVVSLSLAACHTVEGGKDRTPGQIGDEVEQPGTQSPGQKPGTNDTGTSQDPGGTDSGATAGSTSGATTETTESPGETSTDDSSTFLPDPTDTPDEDAHLQYIVVEPGDQIHELDLKTTKDVTYFAVGHFSDGKSKDMSKEVQWSISSPNMGSFTQDKLTIKAQDTLFVETAVVTAKIDGTEARAQITVAAFENDGPQQDFVYILPYEDKAGLKRKTLKFKTKVQELDVFFSVDTTGSMGEEINALSQSLRESIVPELQAQIPSTQFGVGAVEDFPIGDFGRGIPRASRNDQPFRLEQAITPTIAAVQAGISRLTLGLGGDYPESILEGLFQVATGKGLNGPGETMVAPRSGPGVGGVGFRKGSMPVVVSITDAASHAPGETADGCSRDYNAQVNAVAATRAQTEAALEKICARVITVASEGNLDGKPQCSPRVDGEKLAEATDARVSPLVWNGKRPAGCTDGQCCTGLNGTGIAPDADGLCDLVFDVNSQGTGLDKSIVSGVQALAFFAPFDVVAEKEGKQTSESGKPMPNGLTTLVFLKNLEASAHGPLPIPGLPKPTPHGDTFKNVTPGTEVSFRLDAYNNVVRPTTKVQVFRAKIGIKADQCEGLALDDREVVFVVPPKPLVEG